MNEAIDVAQNCQLWTVETGVYIWRYALLVVHSRSAYGDDITVMTVIIVEYLYDDRM